MWVPSHPDRGASSWFVVVGVTPLARWLLKLAPHPAPTRSAPGQRPLYSPCLSFIPERSRAYTSRGTSLGSHPQHPSPSHPSELPPRPQRPLPSGTPDEPVFTDCHSCPHDRAGLGQSPTPSTLPPLPHLPPVPPCGSESQTAGSSSLPPPWGSELLSCPGPSLANDSPPAELSPLLRTRLVRLQGGGQALPSSRRVGSTARPPTHTPTALLVSFIDLLVPCQQ